MVIKIIPCGTLIKTVYGNIEGMITCCDIRFNKIQYEISYFLNGEEQTIWMHEEQFETNKEKIKIGFK